MELEGLRGIAAVIVVIYHNLLAFYAIAFLGIGGSLLQHSRFEDNLYGSPILGLFSGTFAVAIFFVLSGFVLSISYFKGRKSETVQRMAMKRYPRLMLPALASTILCLLLIKLGLSHTQAAAAITGSGWLQSGWNFTAGFWNALWSGTIGIFITGSSMYNNPLWTMQIEFLGSFLVFAFLLLFSKSRFRWAIYAILAAMTFNTWFIAFVIGMGLADLYVAGYIKKYKRNIIATLLLIVIAVGLGGYPYNGAGSGFYHIGGLLPLTGINYLMMSTVLGAAIMVFVVLWSQQVATVLSKRYISIFGKYTFSLYLIHIPILYTFTTGVFLALSAHLSYNMSAIIALISSVPILVVCTVLFEKYIDSPSITFGSKLANLYYDWNEKITVRGVKTRIKDGTISTIRRLSSIRSVIIGKK